MGKRTPFVGGNWKMNTNLASAGQLAEDVGAAAVDLVQTIDIAIFPPFPYLLPVGKKLAQGSVILGAQDVYHQPDGAFTGEVGVDMLNDLGVNAVLAGHSERRHVLGEDDELINLKTRAALDGAVWVVLCIGETLEQREAGKTDDVNRRQLIAGLSEVPVEQVMRQVVIAYEPVWAIGTGLTATPEDAQAAHAAIRRVLAELYEGEAAGSVRVIYGGSVKPGNASELAAQPDIDGFLVGGASLKAEEFVQIARAAGRGDGR